MTAYTLGGPFIGTAALTIVFAVMWRTYRERYLGLWLLASVLWLARYVYAFANGGMSMPSGSVVLPLLAVSRGFFILLGAYSLAGRRLPRLWSIVFVADLVLLAIEALLGPTRILGSEAVTHYLLYAVAMVSAGVIFVLRPIDRGPEAWVVSLALICIGVLQLSFPFSAVLGRSWNVFAPIMMNVAILCAGIGVMMLYFRRELRERERLMQGLASALERALTGYLPICAHCKSIRDEAGEWQRLERFISDRTDAAFTHGICPSCVDEHFPIAA